MPGPAAAQPGESAGAAGQDCAGAGGPGPGDGQDEGGRAEEGRSAQAGADQA